jgi:beta-hydroxyacyl-ACP dehydratase FabZ
MTEAGSTKKLGTADIARVMKLLPHRYPFLMVDRIIDMDRDESAVGIKSVSINEPFFQGHFPGAPVMPGVLIIEALAQAGAVLLLSDIPDRAAKLVYFTGIDAARFRRPVVPGDRIKLTMEVLKLRARNCKMRGTAEVDGELAAEAEIMSALVAR